MKEYPQSKLPESEVIAKYNDLGLPKEYVSFFVDEYNRCYDSVPDEENSSDLALESATGALKWYILYKRLGNSEKWCKAAAEFGLSSFRDTDDIEDIVDCLQEVYHDCYDLSNNSDLEIQCSFITDFLGKSQVFKRFFMDNFTEMVLARNPIKLADEKESIYKAAIDKGKSEEFAYNYAWSPNPCLYWEKEEIREKLVQEGRNQDYIEEYLMVYESEISYQEESYFTELIDGHMKGWEYCKEQGLDSRFVEIYKQVYLEAKHPVIPARIPKTGFDDFVLDIALRRYNGEQVDVEPQDEVYMKQIQLLMRHEKERTSKNQQIIDETMEMMFPDGIDDGFSYDSLFDKD